jgi:cytochrome b
MTIIDNEIEAARASVPAATGRLVWDLPVRLFHWGLVASILGAFVTNRLGVKFFAYHALFGYAAIVLVIFRVAWGLFGTRHARFVNFIRGPKSVLRYLAAAGRGRKTKYAGHNPAGALMVVTLLVAVGTQAIFGLFANDEIFNTGPLAGLVSKDVSLLLTSLHRKLFYWIAAAIAVHIGAAFYYLAVKKENLIGAMVTGRKATALVAPEEAIRSSRGLRAMGIFIAVAALFALLIQFAPTPELDVANL